MGIKVGKIKQGDRRYMYEYKRKRSSFKKAFLLIILMIMVSATSIFIYSMYSKININDYKELGNTTVERVSYIEETDKKRELSLEEVSKSVVGISKIKNTGDSIFNTNVSNELGLGSGFIVSDNGYIITNWHVVQNKYSTCYITLENGDTHSGTVVWADKDLDLAIVKINVNGPDSIKLGDSDNIKLGETVYAIGNPVGMEFQRTVTAGIISGLNRTIKIDDEYGQSYMENLVQTDATINSGNSGGPLINTSGEVIGINTIKISSAEGIGFAIPINTIKPIIESFINTGKFEEANLGIFAYDKEAVSYLNSGLKIDSGIYVAKIMQDGPSNKSNLKVGDIITKIDGKAINKMSELREYIYSKKPGDEVILSILRNKKEREVAITLGKKQ